MEIKSLDELQKLSVIENSDDVELCWFTCLATCSVTGVSAEAVCAE